MAKKKISDNQHFKNATKLYEKNGQSAVFAYANKNGIGYELCGKQACDTESPAINHICLVCGQETTTPEIKRIRTAWEFVEEHYPNYSSSDQIALSDDLSKLVNGEQQKGDDASKMLKDDYGNNSKNPRILIDHNELLVRIYEESIENFYAKQKKK